MTTYSVQSLACDHGPVQCHLWMPEHPVKAVIQVSHGMMSHMMRYDAFSHWMNDQGIAVVGHDHRAHGLTGGEAVDWPVMIDHIAAVRSFINDRLPQSPVFLLGHSFGSFLAQVAIRLSPTDYQGILLSGSAYQSPIVTGIAKFISKCLLWLNPTSPSYVLHFLTFFGFNRGIRPKRTPVDWLSRDRKVADDYMADPHCGNVCSRQFFHSLFSVLFHLYRWSFFKVLPQTMPVLLFSGSDDPLGKKGKGFKTLVTLYRHLHLQSLRVELYENGRHEMINEINKTDVYEMILSFITDNIDG